MRHKNIWIGGVYGAVATAVTWPTVRHLAASIPLGSESTPTVPLFNLWTLGWNVDRLLHGYQGYWNAPIFYPAPGAFAFSEPQPLTGILAAPLWFISPAAAYNLVLLLFLVLNALAAFSLLRHRGLGMIPALLGGLLVETLPFLAHERGVLQLQPVFGVLWALDGLWLLLERPRWQSGAQLGWGMAITFLTSEYYALFLGLMLLTAVPFLVPALRQRAAWTALLAAPAVTMALVLPVALPQLAAIQAMGFSRSIETITNGSADLREYWQVSDQLLSRRWLLLPDVGGQYLFPGFSMLILAAAGAFIGLKRARKRRWTGYLLAAAAVAFLVSLGLNFHLGAWQPHLLLRRYLPGFADLRSPFRLAYFVQIYLALLGAMGLDWLWRRRRQKAVFLLVGLALLELWPLPARLTAVPPPINTNAITAPAIFLPFPNGRGTAVYADTAVWMAATVDEPVVLVNGYSGYFPRLQSQLKRLLADFPSPGGLAALRAMGVQTVIIREDWLSEAQRARLADSAAAGDLQPVGRQNDLALYRLTDSQLRPAQAYSGGWAWQTSLTETAVRLEGYAAVPDSQMYVLSPQIAPLKWRVRLSGSNNLEQVFDVSPANTTLLYHGSDRWLRVEIPRPQAPGDYAIAIQNLETGQTLGQTAFTIPLE